MRLSEKTPARRALDVALTPAKRPVGRPITRWLDTIKSDLARNNIKINLNNKQETISTLINVTKDRQKWRETVKLILMQ